jgi:hypothetical protein
MRMTASWFRSLDLPHTRLWRDSTAPESGLPSDCHLDCIIVLEAVRMSPGQIEPRTRRWKKCVTLLDSKSPIQAVCPNWARTVLCGGCSVMSVPTAISETSPQNIPLKGRTDFRDARHLQVPRDLPDRLAFDKMLAPNPADRLHCQHPPHRSLESERAAHQANLQGVNFGRRSSDSGGQNCTPNDTNRRVPARLWHARRTSMQRDVASRSR